MKPIQLLRVMSLVSALLLSLHISQDIAFNLDPAGLNHVTGVAILTLLVCAAALFPEHLLGKILMLLGGLMAAGMLPLHMRNGFKPEFLARDGVLLFVWTMYVLGVIGFFSVVLAIMAMRRKRAAS